MDQKKSTENSEMKLEMEDLENVNGGDLEIGIIKNPEEGEEVTCPICGAKYIYTRNARHICQEKSQDQ